MVIDLSAAVNDEAVRARYFEKILRSDDPTSGCWLWTGAISGRGHGRFWIGDGRVVIAHRFGWALAHPGEQLPPLVAHACDNPLCQQPAHLNASTPSDNRREWATRRHRVGGALRDSRGARGRARELRDAARDGEDIEAAVQRGIPVIDRDQLPLW